MFSLEVLSWLHFGCKGVLSWLFGGHYRRPPSPSTDGNIFEAYYVGYHRVIKLLIRVIRTGHVILTDATLMGLNYRLGTHGQQVLFSYQSFKINYFIQHMFSM